MSIVEGTISSGNAGNNGGGADAEGTFISSGYNLLGTADRSSGFIAPGDQTGTDALLLDAKLGLLQNNGGSTPTVALLAGSPAIDKGNDAIAPLRDQRHYLRAGVSDIGAFEYQGSPLRFVSISGNGSEITISVEVSRSKYRLERKLDLSCLTGPNWQSISGLNDLVATGDDIESITDTRLVSIRRSIV